MPTGASGSMLELNLPNTGRGRESCAGGAATSGVAVAGIRLRLSVMSTNESALRPSPHVLSQLRVDSLPRRGALVESIMSEHPHHER